MRRSLLRVVGRIAVLVVAGLAFFASPAAADPPAPGDYTSRVTAVEPPVDGVRFDVIGGDSFLDVEVDPGIEVVVLGYDEEPYVRVSADGTVERNRNSPATYINDERYGRVSVPAHLAGVDVSELDPDWETVGSGGTYAWHDHRIHWMAPNSPPAVSRGETFGWNGTVPVIVDGEAIEVHGEITYEHDITPAVWIGAAVVAAVGLGFGLRSRLRVLGVVGLAVAAAGVYVAWATYSLSPKGVGETWTPVGVVAVAAVLGVATVAASERVRPIAALAAASALAGWGILRFGVLTHPVLPTTAPDVVDRGVTALALATAAALAVVGVRSVGPLPVAETSNASDDTDRS